QPEETKEQTSVWHMPYRGAQHRDRADDLRLDPGARRVRTPRVAGPPLARLIRQRLQRRRGRLELARLESRDDLAGECPSLADLVCLEHRVDRGEMIPAHQGQFD